MATLVGPVEGHRIGAHELEIEPKGTHGVVERVGAITCSCARRGRVQPYRRGAAGEIEGGEGTTFAATSSTIKVWEGGRRGQEQRQEAREGRELQSRRHTIGGAPRWWGWEETGEDRRRSRGRDLQPPHQREARREEFRAAGKAAPSERILSLIVLKSIGESTIEWYCVASAYSTETGSAKKRSRSSSCSLSKTCHQQIIANERRRS